MEIKKKKCKGEKEKKTSFQKLLLQVAIATS
jgi:hypothetical protein